MYYTDTMKNTKRKKAYLKYILALLLFGSNGIIASSIFIKSYQIILLRTLLGSLLLLLIVFKSHAFKNLMKHKKDFLFIFFSGICMGVSWMFQYEAYQRIGISITSLLYCLGPILVVIFAQIIFQENITLKKILCLAAVTVGAILTGGVSLQQGANMIGILCALMCAFAYVGMILFNKKSTAVTGLSNSAIQLTSGFLTALIYNLIRWMSGNAPAMTIHHHEWIPILILGLINTGVGCYLYFSSISEIPAQTVAVCDYIEPLSAVLLAAIILHESMTLPQIGGAILIIGGTMLWNLPFQKDINN